jgi:hypothetical protein
LEIYVDLLIIKYEREEHVFIEDKHENLESFKIVAGER